MRIATTIVLMFAYPIYSYQFGTRNEALNRNISNTTHEIGLSYRFGDNMELL